MKVLLEFSRGGLEEHGESIGLIRALILKQGHTLTNDLIKDSSPRTDILPEGMHGKLKKSITDANCIIIEGSVVSLSLGFVLTEAIALGKPVLFLVEQDQFNQRNRFVTSIESPLLVYKSYKTDVELKNIVDDFLINSPLIKTRFNLVLPNRLNSYLIVRSIKLKTNKTDYVIDLIEQDKKKHET